MKKFLFLLLLASCLDIDCEVLKNHHSKQECIIVVEEPPKQSVWFEVKGYHPKNRRKM